MRSSVLLRSSAPKEAPASMPGHLLARTGDIGGEGDGHCEHTRHTPYDLSHQGPRLRRRPDVEFAADPVSACGGGPRQRLVACAPCASFPPPLGHGDLFAVGAGADVVGVTSNATSHPKPATPDRLGYDVAQRLTPSQIDAAVRARLAAGRICTRSTKARCGPLTRISS